MVENIRLWCLQKLLLEKHFLRGRRTHPWCVYFRGSPPYKTPNIHYYQKHTPDMNFNIISFITSHNNYTPHPPLHNHLSQLKHKTQPGHSHNTKQTKITSHTKQKITHKTKTKKNQKQKTTHTKQKSIMECTSVLRVLCIWVVCFLSVNISGSIWSPQLGTSPESQSCPK